MKRSKCGKFLSSIRIDKIVQVSSERKHEIQKRESNHSKIYYRVLKLNEYFSIYQKQS